MAERRKCPHITKDCDIDFSQLLTSFGRAIKMPDGRECMSVFITHFIVVSLARLQVSQNRLINASMESHVANIVGGCNCKHFFIELRWEMTVVDNRCVVGIRSSDPHYLHFCLSTGESKVHLTMPRFNQINIDPGNIHKLPQHNLAISIGIKYLKSFLHILQCYVVFWLHLLIVGQELLNSGITIVISIIGLVEECLQVGVCYCGSGDQSESEEDQGEEFQHLLVWLDGNQSIIFIQVYRGDGILCRIFRFWILICMISSISKTIKFPITTITTKFIDYKPGPPDNLFLNQRQINPAEDQYLIKVKAVGINRAECLHRAGRYAINNEVEKNIGLQAAGQVIDVHTGQKLFDGIALLSGGGYGQWVTAPKTHVMKMPKNLNFKQGAAIPEAWLTAFQLLGLAELKQGQKVVIYAGASGVGTAAIQICNILGYIPYAVVSSKEKGELCKKVGVKEVVYYKDNETWEHDLLKINEGKNFDAVLDCVGPGNAKYTTKLLCVDGRWVFYGTLSGIKGELNFGEVISKRIKLIATTLKTRSKEYKNNLINDFSEKILPEFTTGKAHAVIGGVIECNWQSASSFIEAHKIMESNQNAGKIIIQYLS